MKPWTGEHPALQVRRHAQLPDRLVAAEHDRRGEVGGEVGGERPACHEQQLGTQAHRDERQAARELPGHDPQDPARRTAPGRHREGAGEHPDTCRRRDEPQALGRPEAQDERSDQGIDEPGDDVDHGEEGEQGERLGTRPDVAPAITEAGERPADRHASRGGPAGEPDDGKRRDRDGKRSRQQSFGHRSSTLSSVLDRLDARGLVERSVNPADRRSVVVTPTDEGAVATATVRSVIADLEQHVEAGTSPAERDGFDAVLAAVSSAARTPR